MRKYNSTINNVSSVQLRLACREFVIKLLNYVLQLFSFSDQRLLLLLFRDPKTFHVEEKKRTQHPPHFTTKLRPWLVIVTLICTKPSLVIKIEQSDVGI